MPEVVVVPGDDGDGISEAEHAAAVSEGAAAVHEEQAQAAAEAARMERESAAAIADGTAEAAAVAQEAAAVASDSAEVAVAGVDTILAAVQAQGAMLQSLLDKVSNEEAPAVPPAEPEKSKPDREPGTSPKPKRKGSWYWGER